MTTTHHSPSTSDHNDDWMQDLLAEIERLRADTEWTQRLHALLDKHRGTLDRLGE